MQSIIKRIIYTLVSFRNRLTLLRKISVISRKIQSKHSLSKNLKQEYIRLWKPINKWPSQKWLSTYIAINGLYDPSYISEIDYYNTVEPTLNHKTFCDAYADKNNYHLTIDSDLLPNIYLRCIHGVYYTGSYKPLQSLHNLFNIIPSDTKTIVVKIAFDSGGGTGVGLFINKNNSWQDKYGNVLNEKTIQKTFGNNFVVQEYINQHSFYSQFNRSSVNTVRILTYRSVQNESIIPLQAVLRIGKKGSFVDNQASGGIACGINSSGVLNSFGVNKHGEKILKYNNVDFASVKKIWRFDDIIKTAIEVAPRFFYHRLLGFDLTVDENDKVRLIEINNKNNEINFFQMNNGPLFKHYTKEVIQHCVSNSKTIQLDFDIN